MKKNKITLLKWKSRYLIPFLCACSLLCSTVAFAQTTTVQGKVINTQGESLIGVSIKVKGTGSNTVTNTDGTFKMNVPSKNATIEFSYIGYDTKSIALDGKTNLSVTLEENLKALDEVVVVGYGTQKRASITGAVSTMSDKELLKAPAMGITNVLGARVAGVTMLQSSGQPGNDAASLLIRGQSATYIVDGVKRSFNEIDPNEVESISVLKDATSAAVYGLDASAVIIVTTKKGKAEKARINYSGTYGISQNSNQIEWLDAPGYAYWYNKARVMDGDEAVFTAAQVQKMKDGVDGWGNTDWYDKVFGTGTNAHHNVSAAGGNDKVRFFTSLGTFSQKGNVDKYNYDRYNLRSNVDAKIRNNFSMELGISARVEKRDRPRYSADPDDWHNIPQQAVSALPYVPETITYQGNEYYTSTPTSSSSVSPIASIYESGYYRTNNTYIQSNFSLKYDAPWLKGLNFKFAGAYDLSYQFTKSLSIPYKTALVSAPSSSTETLSYSVFTDNSGNRTLSESASQSTNVVTQTSVNFDRTFGEHKINAIGLAETRNVYGNVLGVTGYGLDFIALDELSKITNKTGAGTDKYAALSGSSSQSRVLGFVGRVNYEYSDRYLAEVSFRRDGSYLFSGMNGSRWVNLPAVSLGWRMNNEEWFSADWIDNLKIRGGIGKTATSGVSPFQYLDLMGISTNQVVLGSASQSIAYASTLGNPTLTWAKCITYNLGTDFSAWKGLLGIEFDVFYKYQYDLLASAGGSYSPSMGGYFYSLDNKNKIDYRGFDFTISHNNHLGDFNYGVKWVGSLAKRTWLYYSGDSQNTPDYMKLTGKEVGSQLGFIAEGLFQSQEEIDNSATIPGSAVLPGCIKYKDRNGDGKITVAQDMGYVGKSAYPRFQSSLNLNGNWKGFDFDLLFQGALGRTIALSGVYTATGSAGNMGNTSFTKIFNHGGNSPVFLAENSWTPEHTDAEFPRLSIVPVSNNNAFASTLYYRSGDYLRLKTFQVGYSLPKRIITTWGINNLRLYVEGSNILTFSELTKYNIDPESPGVNNGYYPQQMTFSFGVNLTL
ncbi:MAG: TonB-dependent receptor [Bacteroidales bacterium]|nr:TonB-dependent receptor [Bacteroidales bacterium]